MSNEFVGDPTPLRSSDYEQAAHTLRCDVAAIRAVALVESSGAGFLPDGRPKILFERHVFHKLTKGRHDGLKPVLSSPSPGGYLGGAREYDRLRAAIDLNREAALQATSWGKFQVMGFNYQACGQRDVESLVRAMVSGEPAHLAAFISFIVTQGLDDKLRTLDWAGFARGYNGSGYARNAYDRKIAQAYRGFADAMPDATMPLLKLNVTGPKVCELQDLLGHVADGQFTKMTHNAVVTFQIFVGI
jgi:hypothetical protein